MYCCVYHLILIYQWWIMIFAVMQWVRFYRYWFYWILVLTLEERSETHASCLILYTVFLPFDYLLRLGPGTGVQSVYILVHCQHMVQVLHHILWFCFNKFLTFGVKLSILFSNSKEGWKTCWPCQLDPYLLNGFGRLSAGCVELTFGSWASSSAWERQYHAVNWLCLTSNLAIFDFFLKS